LKDGQRQLDEKARGIVQEALLHFKDQRYRLQGWVVMNDHVHVLVQPIAGYELEELVRRWKSFTANRLQRECDYSGSVWQDEYMDRIVRDEDELFQKAEYILNNPQKRWPEITQYVWAGWDFAKFGELSDKEMNADTAVRATESQSNEADTAVRPTGSGTLSRTITPATLKRALAGRALLYDKGGDEHFNAISALHKAVRGSDPDAALYWMTRMLESGDDPKYVVRRMVRMASEDIGLADPWALVHAIAAKEAVDFVGMPECNNALAQLCIYLACAPKSNAVYLAYGAAQAAVKEHGALPVPLHIRNAPTKLMKELGYGKDYKYAQDFPGGFVPDNYWPDALKDNPPRLLQLKGRGAEKALLERLRQWWGSRFDASGE
jgi:REP element-mobilizing transposase RayT